jgi:putative tricarboxylic transport membrane protein
MAQGADGAGGGPRSSGPERPSVPGRARDLGGLVIAVALFALAAVIASDASGYRIRRSYAQFGPEIFPYLVAAGTAVLAALTAGLAWIGGFPARERMNAWPVLWITGSVVAQIAIIGAGFGFIAGTAALFGGAARGLGRRPLVLTVLVGAVLAAILYLLFRHGLGLALPAGPPERAFDGLFRWIRSGAGI